jgi:hypothetical protein
MACLVPAGIGNKRLAVGISSSHTAAITGRSAMERRHFTETVQLEKPTAEQAKPLRNEARGTPPGVKRDDLIRRARQIETACHVKEWLSSPGLQPPK